MRAVLRAAFFVFALALCAEGAVRELWRSGLTNPVTDGWGFPLAYYTAHQSLVTSNGDTIVAGVLATNLGRAIPCVASFDSSGNKQWEYVNPLLQLFYTDAMVVAGSNAVVVTGRIHDDVGTIRWTAKIIEGRLAWYRIDPRPIANFASGAALAADEAGNVFIYQPGFIESGDGGFNLEAFVSKLGPSGVEWWRRPLPIKLSFLSGLGLRDSLAWSPGGQLVVSGVPNWITALNEDAGAVRWVRRHSGVVNGSSVVAAGARSICVAGNNGYTVFAHGRKIAARNDARFEADRILVTPAQEFLLTSRSSTFATLVSASGRVRWRINTGFYYGIGFAPTRDGGFVEAIGDLKKSLTFVKMNRHGITQSTNSFSRYGFLPGFGTTTTGHQFLAAPGGTFRIVLNASYDHAVTRGNGNGVIVASFKFED